MRRCHLPQLYHQRAASPYRLCYSLQEVTCRCIDCKLCSVLRTTVKSSSLEWEVHVQ